MSGEGLSGGTVMVLGLAAAGVIVPIVVAEARGVVNKGPTILLSVLLGWSCIGALVPLIVALASRTRADINRQAVATAVATAAYMEQLRQAGWTPPPQVTPPPEQQP